MDLLRISLFTVSLVSLSLSPRYGASSLLGWRNGLQKWRGVANILNKESAQKSNGGLPALWLGEMLTNSQLKKLQCYQMLHSGLVRTIVNAVMNLPVPQVPWNSSKT
jgi:hypothetical protein